MHVKAIGLFSGGLDSILAVKLMKEQGIEIDVLHYDIGFENLRIARRTKKREDEVTQEDVERQLGVTIRHLDVTREFLQIVFHPKHGYGKGMNPCIDCKIFILQKAREYMDAQQAHFVFTGEVLGQRPMSQQRQTMLQTERASGLSGYLLRPLSAKLLEPTIPELNGWVDREQLLDISGRSRAAQAELAERYQLRYPQPAGGCLLTDQNYTRRFRELLTHKTEPDITPDDITLLKLGRHFRLADDLKLIVGRHELDNTLLEAYKSGRWWAEVRDIEGPLAIVEGTPSEAQFIQIAQIVVSYTRAKQADQATVEFFCDHEQRAITITPELTFNPNQWRIT